MVTTHRVLIETWVLIKALRKHIYELDIDDKLDTKMLFAPLLIITG